MELPQKRRRGVRLDQTGVRDLHVGDAPAAAAARDPQKLILQERERGVGGIFPVFCHLRKGRRDLCVRYGLIDLQIDGVLRGLPLGKNIAVQVDLLQVGEDGLSIL